MYATTKVNLLNLLLSLSDALDLACPSLNQHQIRTAFIAWQLGEKANLEVQDTIDLFMAAVIHDIGALTPEEKLEIVLEKQTDNQPHCIKGEKLLSKVVFAQRSARIIRYHHTDWVKLKELLDEPTAQLIQRSTSRPTSSIKTGKSSTLLTRFPGMWSTRGPWTFSLRCLPGRISGST